MITISSSSSLSLGKLIAEKLGSRSSEVARKRFPDGELYVRIDTDLADETAVLVGNTRTDQDFMETLLLLEAAQGRHPDRIIVVIPYFGYARQHMRYRAGEPISSYAIGRAILDYADSIYCVEIHDERAMAPFNGKIHNIKISSTLADFVAKWKVDYVISPDDGGKDRADSVARIVGCESMALDKKRIDDTNVEIVNPDLELKGKRAVLVDDIISTGGTIMKASQMLVKNGLSWVSVAAIHGLFINQSAEKISGSVSEVAVSNTIETPYSKIDVSGAITDRIQEEIK